MGTLNPSVAEALDRLADYKRLMVASSDRWGHLHVVPTVADALIRRGYATGIYNAAWDTRPGPRAIQITSDGIAAARRARIETSVTAVNDTIDDYTAAEAAADETRQEARQ